MILVSECSVRVFFFLSKSWQPPLSFTAAAEAWKEN